MRQVSCALLIVIDKYVDKEKVKSKILNIYSMLYKIISFLNCMFPKYQIASLERLGKVTGVFVINFICKNGFGLE